MIAIAAKQEDDVLPILEAYIKGQMICNVNVDGEAQVSVMSEKMMHHLGLEVQGKSKFRVKWQIMYQSNVLESLKGLRSLCVG